MAALMMYAVLLVGYGLSVRSLLSQSRSGRGRDIATRNLDASSKTTALQSQPRTGSHAAAA